MFITSCVINRSLRRRSNKAASAIPQSLQKPSMSLIRGYVAAMVDLWCHQKAMGMNSHPTPRDAAVRNLLRLHQQKDTERDRQQFTDKGRETLLDGYTEEQFEQTCSQIWMRKDESTSCLLRTLLDLCIG
jgi:hypothetical protein